MNYRHVQINNLGDIRNLRKQASDFVVIYDSHEIMYLFKYLHFSFSKVSIPIKILVKQKSHGIYYCIWLFVNQNTFFSGIGISLRSYNCHLFGHYIIDEIPWEFPWEILVVWAMTLPCVSCYGSVDVTHFLYVLPYMWHWIPIPIA